MSRMFANGPGDRGSIVVIPNYVAFLDTLHYKVRIKGKVKQSNEWSSALPYIRCSSY